MVTGTKMTSIAVAEFSRDMLDTLVADFDIYARNGVVSVEVTENGLWLANPSTGRRVILGVTGLPGFMAAQ